MRVCCGVSILCLASSTASAFNSSPVVARHHRSNTSLRASELSRGTFLTTSCSAILVFIQSANADDTTTTTTEATVAKSIAKCDVDDDCVSTANIRDTKGSYSPPWTFEVSPDEAFARIKGVLKSDDQFVITEVDDEQRYIRAYAKRITVDSDEVEFLVKGDDKVVLYRSFARKNAAGPSVSDFGANRKRIDMIRKKGAVFDLMGGGETADSFDGGGAAQRGNGPLGQLKSFYGLQRGTGFESVFEEDDE